MIISNFYAKLNFRAILVNKDGVREILTTAYIGYLNVTDVGHLNLSDAWVDLPALCNAFRITCMELSGTWIKLNFGWCNVP